MLKLCKLPSGRPEVFLSIQGEGITSGVPAVFIRLAMCNLACRWCDTRYSWDPRNPASESLSCSINEILDLATAFQCTNIVITGGEPLLQQEMLEPLVEALSEQSYHIEVETNGTIHPSATMLKTVSQWNVSPKTSSSGIPSELRETPSVLQTFCDLDNAYFKFVISDKADLDDVEHLVIRYRIPAGRVILMPEGITVESMMGKNLWIAEMCIKKGFRFSTRLHILLWGDQRGR